MKYNSLELLKNLLLAVIVPVILIGILEIASRLLHAERWFGGSKQPSTLEMPTWMMREDSNTTPGAIKKVDQDSLEWLSMFEEGDSYRVRLIPNIERRVSNTFSQIDVDRRYKYLIKSNSIGFRGPELQRKRSVDTFRILVFGDSSSFGWGVDQERAFSSILPAYLEKIKPALKFEVGNFAIPGDSSEYGRLIFDRFAREYQPDFVVLGFGANDAKRVVTPHHEQVAKFTSSPLPRLVRSITSYSTLAKMLQNLINKLIPQTSKAGTPALRNKKKRKGSAKISALQKIEQSTKSVAKHSAVKRSRYRENLLYMGEVSKSLGAKATLLLTLCTPGNYAKTAKKLAERDGFLYFNGQKMLEHSISKIKSGEIEPGMVAKMKEAYGEDLERDSLFYVSSDGCHPNALGHELIAKSLSKLIADHL